MTRRLAAVTGATGFLGAHLVQAFHAAGYDVRVLARREPSAPGWGDARPEVIAGDLSDDDRLDRLARDADVVVHVAGAIKAADLAGFMAVNRDGAARMAAAARRSAPNARFILVSSLAAREPQLSDYAASKRAGEDAAAAIMPAARLTIVRPPAIYGPGDRETLAIFKAATRSPVLPVLSAKARLALVHVQDAASAIVALALGPSGTYALADGRPEGYFWREIFQAAAKASGRRPILLNAPSWLIPGLARIALAVARLSGGAPILTEGKVREMLHPDWGVAPQELASGLPKPYFTLAEGFTHTLQWYFSSGWIPMKRGVKAPH